MELIIYYILLFISGSFIGSFLNLVSDRLVSDEPVLWGRSHCEKCQTPLRPYNLVPIFSFLFQRGRCTFCNAKLSWFYPLSEALTGASFVLAAILSGVFVQFDVKTAISFVYLIVMFSMMLILLFTDSKYMLIPDVIAVGASVISSLFITIYQGVYIYIYYKTLSADEFGKYLIKAGFFKDQVLYALGNIGLLFATAFLIAGFFWLIVVLTKGKGMGAGDIKLGFLIGVFNGYPQNLLTVFLGFVLGAAYSLLLMLLRKKGMKDRIAFGPFLIIASIISLVWGSKIIEWYLGLL